MGQQISNFAFLDPGASLTLVSSAQRAHAVEFPVLARFAVLAGNRPWRPFVTFGPTIRRTFIGAISSATILSGTDLSPEVLVDPQGPEEVQNLLGRVYHGQVAAHLPQ